MSENIPSDPYLELQAKFQNGIPINPRGVSSLLTRQLILHQYSPKVSVISSDAADLLVQVHGFSRFVQFLQAFEDHLYGPFSLLGHKLHVKFVAPIDEILRNQLDFKSDRNRNQAFSELFDELFLKLHTDTHPDPHLQYLNLITKVSTNLTLVPFETFNHPIVQMMVISLEDSLQVLKNLISDWKYLSLPKWVDLNNMFLVFLIVVESENPESLQKALKLQESLRVQFNIRSIIVVHEDPLQQQQESVLIAPLGSDLDPAKTKVPLKFKATINNMILDLISKYLVPFMERKMHLWNEEIVLPRRSITGRLFNVGRRWGDSGPQQLLSYNSTENFYYITSNEFLIRKLGDWYFMLRDYKKSYTTYELLKKDFLKTEAWNYLASLQEFMMISLVIGSSQKISVIGNGITKKIIDDVIDPAVESLQYSYLSRCYLKTFSLRSLLTIAELFISLGESNQVHGLVSDNSLYFNKSYHFLNKLMALNLVDTDNKTLIMKRISYIYDIYYVGDRKNGRTETEDGDLLKLLYRRDDLKTIGLTRHRKSELWDHLSQQHQQALHV